MSQPGELPGQCAKSLNERCGTMSERTFLLGQPGEKVNEPGESLGQGSDSLNEPGKKAGERSFLLRSPGWATGGRAPIFRSSSPAFHRGGGVFFLSPLAKRPFTD